MAEPPQVDSVNTLLFDDEPPAWQLHQYGDRSPLLFLCDHASNQVPRSLKQLGLSTPVFQRHIAYDIGCQSLSKSLAKSMHATVLQAGYSRLVIDLNRHPGDGSSIPEVSDEIEIPGNHGLSPDQINAREQALFWPYHNQVDKELEKIQQHVQNPIICSIHSFTPHFRGFSRPWHIGVLWDRDRRLADPMLHHLRRHASLCVGDNEPYHARNPLGYTMDIHGERNGHLHVLLEIRQDLIGDAAGVSEWSNIIANSLHQSLQELGIEY